MSHAVTDVFVRRAVFHRENLIQTVFRPCGSHHGNDANGCSTRPDHVAAAGCELRVADSVAEINPDNVRKNFAATPAAIASLR
jgi:hypothetical protein